MTTEKAKAIKDYVKAAIKYEMAREDSAHRGARVSEEEKKEIDYAEWVLDMALSPDYED